MLFTPTNYYKKYSGAVKSLLNSFRGIPAVSLILCAVILYGFENSNSEGVLNPKDSRISFNAVDRTQGSDSTKVWVATWTAAPQLVEPRNLPPQPGLSNNTFRQVVRVSLGGDSLRFRLSNEFSSGSIILKAVQIAASKGGSSIDVSSIKELKFNGKPEVVIKPGEAISSDPASFHLKPRMNIAITIYFGETPADVTGHPGSRTTSYLLSGNKISTIDFTGSAEAEHWYIISGIDVRSAESSAAIAILGNSITDGRGSGTNKQDRWPDILAERLLKNPSTCHVAVLNQGIGGNCVLRFCLGPSALDRIERDVINQQRVRWLIIMEGINDIGQTRDSTAADKVAQELIAAYQSMINYAHTKSIKVYGATLTPIGKSFYYTIYHEAARNIVNHWIRNSGRFDAVIDFDKVLRNPKDPVSILPDAQSGDYLHPNETGYKMLGEAIDLKLFE